MRVRGGFTMIEMTVVLVVLVVFATLILPNVVNMRSAQAKREIYGQVLDLTRQARQEAIQSGLTYAIDYDAAKTEFDLKHEPPPQNAVAMSGTVPTASQRPLAAVQSASDLQQEKSLTAPQGIQASRFVTGQNSVDPGSWLLHFYPDGTSDGGGVEFTEGQQTQSVEVTKDGLASIVPGPLPDISEQRWTAGTYAQQD